MPANLTITKPDLTTKLGLKGTELVKWALLIDKVSGNASQAVNSATFKNNWGVDVDTLSKTLSTMQRAKLVQTTYANFTVTWAAPTPTTGMTAAELQDRRTGGIMDDWTSYVYYALLLTKGTAAAQTVDPAFYAAAPWSIPQANLIAEVNAIASKDSPVFTVDYPSITVLWLQTIGNS